VGAAGHEVQLARGPTRSAPEDHREEHRQRMGFDEADGVTRSAECVGMRADAGEVAKQLERHLNDAGTAEE